MEVVGACMVIAEGRPPRCTIDENLRLVKEHMWDLDNPHNKLQENERLYCVCKTAQCTVPDHHKKVLRGQKFSYADLKALNNEQLSTRCKRLVEESRAKKEENETEDFAKIPIRTAANIKRVGECYQWVGHVREGGFIYVMMNGQFRQLGVHLYELFGYGTYDTITQKMVPVCGGVENCVRPSHNVLRTTRETEEEYRARRLAVILERCTKDGDCLLYPAGIDRDGYAHAFYWDGTKILSRLMYTLAHPDEDISKLQVAHKCVGRRNCISLTCLEAKPCEKNNFDDRLRDGTLIRGIGTHFGRFTEAEAWECYQLRFDLTVKERAEMYGVTEHTIRNIDNLVNYTYVTDPENFEMHAREVARRRRERKAARGPTTVAQYQAMKKHILEVSGVDPVTGCVIPKNKAKSGGYVYFVLNYEAEGAHRIMYSVDKNDCMPIPDELVVRHKCEPKPNKKCCNPDHLELGTLADNSHDNVTEEQREMALRVVQIHKDFPELTMEARFDMLQDDETLTLKPNSVKHMRTIELGQTYKWLTGVNGTKERNELRIRKKEEDYVERKKREREEEERKAEKKRKTMEAARKRAKAYYAKIRVQGKDGNGGDEEEKKERGWNLKNVSGKRPRGNKR